ncbi:MAG: malto-oligosyltrehalose trehalohydrolase, partial [Candidatus Omnitrophica bacterium]|nr:malto-oligosyltrehalose trehalohydrolase [Candidatus Omnitrophota bacterium]
VAAGLGPGSEYAFSLDGGPPRPDPCSRRQARGVHGPSVVVAPPPRDDLAEGWRGVRLDDLVFYEVHVGTATAEGTFAALERQLPRIRDLGITALELMPVAEWAGPRGWGYDGVLLYCPHAAYGGYGALRRLVAAAHRAGLAVFLDVVYNHFGPEGNYLPEFGPYLDPARKTPWGAAVNFDGPGSAGVRRHVVDNARYWIAEHGIDGLRLDAIHGIVDGSPVHVVAEIAAAVQELGPQLGREVHVVAESDLNDVKVVSPRGEGGWGCDAQWNDDFRHALHACLTGERQGILADFGRFEQLARAMREGFAFQGDYSVFRGDRHGTDSRRIPPRRFVVFCQNHDQVGNRPRGERLASLVPPEALPLAAGLAILSPYLPLLFMGEERGEVRPFLFFTSFPDEDLGRAVRAGRTADCRALGFDDEVPDPQDEATFRASASCSGVIAARFSGLSRGDLPTPLQPVRSFPLNSATKPSGGVLSAAREGPMAHGRTIRTNSDKSFMSFLLFMDSDASCECIPDFRLARLGGTRSVASRGSVRPATTERGPPRRSTITLTALVNGRRGRCRIGRIVLGHLGLLGIPLVHEHTVTEGELLAVRERVFPALRLAEGLESEDTRAVQPVPANMPVGGVAEVGGIVHHRDPDILAIQVSAVIAPVGGLAPTLGLTHLAV